MNFAVGERRAEAVPPAVDQLGRPGRMQGKGAVGVDQLVEELDAAALRYLSNHFAQADQVGHHAAGLGHPTNLQGALALGLAVAQALFPLEPHQVPRLQAQGAFQLFQAVTMACGLDDPHQLTGLWMTGAGKPDGLGAVAHPWGQPPGQPGPV